MHLPNIQVTPQLSQRFMICILSLTTVWTIIKIANMDPKKALNTVNRIGHQRVGTVADLKNNANITVVTAFFDIGPFPKGTLVNIVKSSKYHKWAMTFRYLQNNLIIYTDSKKFQQLMSTIRENLMDKTRINLIERSSSWAFQNNDKISAIYKQKDYPKHYPNTVISEYACAQHAKYDVISRAAKENIFGTRYFMWLDVGYFRNRVDSKQPFYLSKPGKFNDSKIAMNRVFYRHLLSAEPKSIFLKNMAYVGGGLMFGERKQVIKFSSDVKRAVEYFIGQGLINTDQQVIYAMFSEEGRKVIKPEVELQCYYAPNDFNWFFLGKSMVKLLDYQRN